MQEMFFSIWQVAHELERRGCLARVFEFEPLEPRDDALDRIAEESLWVNVLLPRFFFETVVLQSTMWNLIVSQAEAKCCYRSHYPVVLRAHV